MRATLVETPEADLALYARLDSVGQAVAELASAAQRRPGAAEAQRVGRPVDRRPRGPVMGGHWETRQMPTATQRRDLEIATAGWTRWSATSRR